MNLDVLIVEDEFITALELEDRLIEEGFNVLGALNTAEKAIDFAKEKKPHFILLDIMLKGEMDGIQAAKIFNGFQIPVIFLSAYADKYTWKRISEITYYAFINKPFDFEEIRSVLNRLRKELQ